MDTTNPALHGRPDLSGDFLMSIREDAINGKKTALLKKCAEVEGMHIDELIKGVANGTIAITKNKHHKFDKVIAIGKGTSTKVNANIGSSKAYPELEGELQKLCVAVKAGADTMMDLSMGGDLDAFAGGFWNSARYRSAPFRYIRL